MSKKRLNIFKKRLLFVIMQSNVSMEALRKLCIALDCNIADIVEFVIKGKSAKSGGGFAVVMLLIGIALLVVGITQI